MATFENNNNTEPTAELNSGFTPVEELQPNEPSTPSAATESTGKVLEDTKNCTINDERTPILVLFGPSQCGKSMTMVRLVRYLRRINYTVEPRIDFRPADDQTYKLRCDEFNNTIDTYEPLPGTKNDDYMLATASDSRGNSVLQILEAPGEAYFSLLSKYPTEQGFPAYFNKIKNSRAPKIWCFFIEPDWRENKHGLYVQRIKGATRYINLQKDKIILLYNKIDKKSHFINFNKVNQKAAMTYANQQYPGLFNIFKNDRMVEKLWRPYLCEFVPFYTGDYSDNTFTESDDRFPAALLKAIL